MHWEDLKRDIKGRHPHARDFGDHVRIVMGARQGASMQRIGLRVHQGMASNGESALMLVAEAARAIAIQPAEALQHNFSWALGAMALDGVTLVIRHMLLMDGLLPDVLEHVMQSLVVEAAALKRALAPRPMSTNPLEHYRD